MTSPYLELSRTARQIGWNFMLLHVRRWLSAEELHELRAFLARRVTP